MGGALRIRPCGNRTGQREGLSSDAVTAETSAKPKRGSEAGMPLQRWSTLKQGVWAFKTRLEPTDES